MLTEQKRDEINEKIADLFTGLEIDDVAGIMTVQLAMLVTQGADDAEGAMEFLDDIYDDVEGIVETFPFGEDEGDADDSTPPPADRLT